MCERLSSYPHMFTFRSTTRNGCISRILTFGWGHLRPTLYIASLIVYCEIDCGVTDTLQEFKIFPLLHCFPLKDRETILPCYLNRIGCMRRKETCPCLSQAHLYESERKKDKSRNSNSSCPFPFQLSMSVTVPDHIFFVINK